MAQQVKSLMHASQQFKQNLTKMNYVLDTQEIATNHPVDDVQVTTAVAQTTSDQVMAEIKPLQRIRVQVPSSSAHTIYLTNSDQEEEVSLVPVVSTEFIFVRIGPIAFKILSSHG